MAEKTITLDDDMQRWLTYVLSRERKRALKQLRHTETEQAEFKAGVRQALSTPAQYAQALKRGIERQEFNLARCSELAAQLGVNLDVEETDGAVSR